MAVYGHICPYMQHLGAQEMCEIPSQHIHTQEAGACYTKLNSYSEAPSNFHMEGCSTSPATQ